MTGPVGELAELWHEVPVHQLASAPAEHALAHRRGESCGAGGASFRVLVKTHGVSYPSVAVPKVMRRLPFSSASIGEVTVGDIGEGEHPAVSAFVAFAGGLQ